MARTFLKVDTNIPIIWHLKSCVLMGRYLTVFKTLEPLLHSFQRSRSFNDRFPLFEEQLLEEDYGHFP